MIRIVTKKHLDRLSEEVDRLTYERDETHEQWGRTQAKLQRAEETMEGALLTIRCLEARLKSYQKLAGIKLVRAIREDAQVMKEES